MCNGSRTMVINIAYAVPPESRKATLWHDGFTAAVSEIGREHNVRWLNIHPDVPDQGASLARLDDCDFLIVKSNWRWIVDDLVRHHSKSARRGLMISGTGKPPWRRRALRFYDVVFYETAWYEPQLRRHPDRIHAFGIDTNVMRPEPAVPREIDWLSVGAMVPYKRHERLLDKPGRKVLASDFVGADPTIRKMLENGGAEVLDFRSYSELADLYRRARNVLVASTEDGGGERAVLEARASGCALEIASDNRKLQTLLDGPIWDHVYYARQLLSGAHAQRFRTTAVGADE
jgi:glycosyltransferase involved in cell wall biosynthesis